MQLKFFLGCAAECSISSLMLCFKEISLIHIFNVYSYSDKWQMCTFKKQKPKRPYFVLWSSLPLPHAINLEFNNRSWPQHELNSNHYFSIVSLQWKHSEGLEECWYCIFGLFCQRKVNAKFPGFLWGLQKAVTQHTTWLSVDSNDDHWDLVLRACFSLSFCIHCSAQV